MAWFLDRVPSLGNLSVDHHGMIKFGRWGGPTNKALKLLDSIDPMAIISFDGGSRLEEQLDNQAREEHSLPAPTDEVKDLRSKNVKLPDEMLVLTARIMKLKDCLRENEAVGRGRGRDGGSG